METKTELEIKVCEFKQKYFSASAKSLTDRDKLFDYCIRKAWADAMQRERFEGRSKSKILQNGETIKKHLKSEIERVNYASDFDGWHKDMCQNTDYNMRVGVWQKFINMTFKYLYCVKNYFPEMDFSRCHCPVDSVIARELSKQMAKNEKHYFLVSSIANSREINWNNIDYGGYLSFEEVVSDKSYGKPKLTFDFLHWHNN